MDSFGTLRVVSDLHLGGEPGRQIFQQKKALADGINELCAGQVEPVGLALNGDVVDFLAEANADTFDPKGAPERLRRIMRDPGFDDVFDALAKFVQTKGRVLVLVLGNHDVEMALLEVQEALLAKLSSKDKGDGDGTAINSDVRGRVRFATQGYGYRCDVGGALGLPVPRGHLGRLERGRPQRPSQV